MALSAPFRRFAQLPRAWFSRSPKAQAALRSLHRRLATRILLAWGVISTLVGGGVYLYEAARMDGRVEALAASAVAQISPEIFLLPPAERDARFNTLVAEVMAKDFAVVEWYDRDRRPLLSHIPSRWARLEHLLADTPHDFPKDDRPYFEQHRVGAFLTLTVVAPIVDPQGLVVGYFEGVYVADPAVLAGIRRDLLITLGLTLLTVLITALALYPVIYALQRDVIRKSQRILGGNLEILEVLGSAIAQRDSDTNEHNYRVTLYALCLGEALGCDGEIMRALIAGAFLHDVGKIGVSDTILLKPGPLTPEEFRLMQGHVDRGVEIVHNSPWLRPAVAVIAGHHERWDGRGYPKGLAGEKIPLVARIFAVVDVFDALTSRRPYKEALPVAESLAILEADAGSHFDPAVVAVFLQQGATWFAEISALGPEAIRQRLGASVARYFMA